MPSLTATIAETILAPNYNSQKYIDGYLKPHMRRFNETVEMLRMVAQPKMRVVDVGSYGSLVPALKDLLGLNDITITQPCDGNPSLSEDSYLLDAQKGAAYSFHVDRFDVEGTFPYSDQTFDLVLFTEVLEHLAYDPVHTLRELNRITRDGGWLLLSTPNCASAKSLLKVLVGRNPNFYPAYSKERSRDRHNREYAPSEVKELLKLTGYDVRVFRTMDVYDDFAPLPLKLLKILLALGRLCSFGLIRSRDRGDTIFAVGKKSSAPSERYPSFLYA
jgi:SAM-dependent methyltransferase